MTQWISLVNATTGNVLSRSTPDFGSRWEVITRAVAEGFECNSADLDTVEDDDGREFVTLNGEIIVEIIDGYFTGPPNPIILFIAAASF